MEKLKSGIVVVDKINTTNITLKRVSKIVDKLYSQKIVWVDFSGIYYKVGTEIDYIPKIIKVTFGDSVIWKNYGKIRCHAFVPAEIPYDYKATTAMLKQLGFNQKTQQNIRCCHSEEKIYLAAWSTLKYNLVHPNETRTNKEIFDIFLRESESIGFGDF